MTKNFFGSVDEILALANAAQRLRDAGEPEAAIVLESVSCWGALSQKNRAKLFTTARMALAVRADASAPWRRNNPRKALVLQLEEFSQYHRLRQEHFRNAVWPLRADDENAQKRIRRAVMLESELFAGNAAVSIAVSGLARDVKISSLTRSGRQRLIAKFKRLIWRAVDRASIDPHLANHDRKCVSVALTAVGLPGSKWVADAHDVKKLRLARARKPVK